MVQTALGPSTGLDSTKKLPLVTGQDRVRLPVPVETLTAGVFVVVGCDR